MANIFKTMGFAGPEDSDERAVSSGCEKLTGLIGEVGLLVKLHEIGFEESHVDNIVRETLKSAQLTTNPRQPSEKDVKEVLREII